MNFDELQPAKNEGEDALKNTKRGGVAKWLGKQAAIATAVGAGYFGAMGGDSQAQEQKPSPEGNKAKITNVEKAEGVKETSETKMGKFVTAGKESLKKVLLDSSGNTDLYRGFMGEVNKFYVEAVTADGIDANTISMGAKEFKKMLDLFSNHIQPGLLEKSTRTANLDSEIAKDDGQTKIGNVTLKEVLETNRATNEYNKKLDEYWLGQAQKFSANMDEIIKGSSK